jgi:hypothetical protein
MSLLIYKHPMLLMTRRKAQRIMPPLRATMTPNPGLDILVNSQRMSLLDHADQELASARSAKCSFRGFVLGQQAHLPHLTCADLCSSKATPEEQAKCWEVGRLASIR